MKYILILTFFAGQGAHADVNPVYMPIPYASYDECRTAGREAKVNYNGGPTVDWTCVSAGKE